MNKIICSGFGGQGVLTAGMLLIYAGAADGKEVSFSPSYGSEMRGGTANCNVIISENKIGSPHIEICDMLLAMNGPSIDKFKDSVRDGGLIFVNSSLISKKIESQHDCTIINIAATGIANELSNARAANLVMLGAVMKITNMFEINSFVKSVDDYFLSKGKTNSLNAACILKGYASV